MTTDQETRLLEFKKNHPDSFGCPDIDCCLDCQEISELLEAQEAKTKEGIANDLRCVTSMIKGGVEPQKIINYIHTYLLTP